MVAERGARVTGIDVSETFIRYAKEAEEAHHLGIDYRLASAVNLPFRGACFDFATAFMSLMDIPETDRVLAEVFRVLKPGGFFQFSITHPCFDTPHRRNLRDEGGHTYAVEVGEYFAGREDEVKEWLFSAAPQEAREGRSPFRIPVFMRPLSSWLNRLVEAGFVLERFGEPYPGGEAVAERPGLQDAQVVACFLQVRAGKPATTEGWRASRSLRLPARVARSGRSGRRTPYRHGRGTWRALYSPARWP